VQRRLFIIFLLFSVVPAVAFLLLNWHMGQQYLDLLESPGFQQSVDSSLYLARDHLAGRLTAVHDEAAAVAAAVDRQHDTWPETAEGVGYRFTDADGRQKIVGALAAPVFDELAERHPRQRTSPARITTTSGDWLVASPSHSDGWILFVRPFPPETAARLDAVTEASKMFSQFDLYYSDLMRQSMLITLLVIGVIVVGASLYLSRRVARRIAGPVKALAAGADQVARGNLDHRIETTAPHELGELITAFNRMTGDLQTNKQNLVRAERIAAWQGIARRLAHEIKNPLTPITLAMHRIEKRADDPAVTDAVATVLEEAENLKRLADEFSLYARLPEPQREAVDLEALIRGVVELYVDPARVNVDWREMPEWSTRRRGIEVRGDPGQLRQVLANLVKNALQAMSGKGRLILETNLTDGMFMLTVTDDGPGLPADPERIFEPYFTTRDTGTGLGLAIARKIVQDHGGTLTATPADGGGATFALSLPVVATSGEQAETSKEQP